ncbi:polysaccharide lyase beta-sandwich domain-containing protein [Streptomyces sp. NPDC002206]
MTPPAGSPTRRRRTPHGDHPQTSAGRFVSRRPPDGDPRTTGNHWLRYANTTQRAAVGYVFLDTPQVRVSLDEVTRSRRVVRTSNPDTAVTRTVLGVTVDQAPGAEPACMAYALVPNAGGAQLASYPNGPLQVLANTPRLQAVSHTGLGLRAANTFTPGWHEVGGLRMDGPASVIVQRRGHRGPTTVAVSDPTMGRDRAGVLIRGRSLRKVSSDDGVRVSPVHGGTRVDVDTRHAYGRSFTVTLQD